VLLADNNQNTQTQPLYGHFQAYRLSQRSINVPEETSKDLHCAIHTGKQPHYSTEGKWKTVNNKE